MTGSRRFERSGVDNMITAHLIIATKRFTYPMTKAKFKSLTGSKGIFEISCLIHRKEVIP
jgi:hypothetical protein